MEKVVKLFNMGEGPDDVEIRHIGTDIHILVKGRYMATVSGVHDHIQRDKNYPGKFTDVIVDRYGDRDKKREVIITLVHKTALTVDEIQSKCGERIEPIDGPVFYLPGQTP